MTEDLKATVEGNVRLVLLADGHAARVRYRNWRGEVAIRNIEFTGAPHWGHTQWHPEPQWLIAGTDMDRQEHRVWAIADMEPVA